jgi:hypothetical protein
MAGNFRLKIDVDGFNEVRRESALQEHLHQMGESAASAAGGEPDFIVVDSPSKTRARVVVITATPKGMRAEATDRALSRAFGAGS